MDNEKPLWKAAGKRLAIARVNAGFASQKQLADAVGVSGPTIAKYEQGVREIPISLLHWLSEKHGVNVNWLLTGEGDPVDDPSKGPALKREFDIALLQRLHDTVQVVFVECKQSVPPRAVTAEAARLYNELLTVVADVRDSDVVEAMLPVLRERFRKRIANAEPGTGKRSAS